MIHKPKTESEELKATYSTVATISVQIEEYQKALQVLVRYSDGEGVVGEVWERVGSGVLERGRFVWREGNIPLSFRRAIGLVIEGLKIGKEEVADGVQGSEEGGD